MSTTVALNGSNFSIPRTGDDSWSNTGGVDDFLVALSTGVLQKAGGAFTLTAEVNFGGSFGLKSLYYKSTGTNPATAGVLRLANAESVKWRNAANSADLDLTVDASNNLNFNGTPIVTLALGAASTALVMNVGGTAYSWAQIANANISSSAAIAYSKLALTGAILNADLAGSIAYSKLSLTGAILNADLAGSIAYSKLSLTGAILNADLAGSIAYSKLTLTGAVVNADISASAAIAYSKLALSGSIATADLASGLLVPSTKGGTGVNNAGTLTYGANNITLTTSGVTSVTLPTSGTVSTLAGAEVITNKDHDGGTASNTSRLTVPKAALSTLTALTRKQGTVVYDTTANALLVDDGSNLNAIGGGSGEKNYCTSPNTASGWTASGAGVTVATDTTAAELPRATTTKTGIKITGVSGSTAYAYFRFTLDASDYTKKMKLQFDQAPISGYAASDFKVDIYSNTASDYTGTSTRLALSTDSSSVSAIPNLTGTFRSTWDAPTSSAPYIEVRIGLNGTNTHALVISDAIVGPGIVVQGATVGAPLAWTPTFTGMGTVTNIATFYNRVGSKLKMWGTFKVGTPTATNAKMSLPSGLTVNSTYHTDHQNILGTAVENGSSASGVYTNGTGLVGLYDASDSASVFWAISNDTIGNDRVAVGQNGSTIFNNNVRVAFNFEFEVSEWAGSGTVNIAQNDLEYYGSTTGTWDAASASGDTVYGPSGSPIAGALTATRSKVVLFKTPLPVGTRPIIEYRVAGTQTWIDQSTSYYATAYQGGLAIGFGASISALSTTQATIQFNQYATPGTSWNSSTGALNWDSSRYDAWRLTKAAPGQAIGYGAATTTSAGLLQPVSSMADSLATMFGRKVYSHGGSYSGALAPTVTLGSGGGTLTTVNLADFIPYQMQDGNWRMKFNMSMTVSSTSRSAATFAVAGVTFATSPDQWVSGGATLASASNLGYSLALPNSGNINVTHNAALTGTEYTFSGDVKLASKPTWAY